MFARPCLLKLLEAKKRFKETFNITFTNILYKVKIQSENGKKDVEIFFFRSMPHFIYEIYQVLINLPTKWAYKALLKLISNSRN